MNSRAELIRLNVWLQLTTSHDGKNNFIFRLWKKENQCSDFLNLEKPEESIKLEYALRIQFPSIRLLNLQQ